MIKIGLTGGLATGKSAVLTMVRASGVTVIDADRLCNEIAQPYQEAWWGIYKHFGRGCFAPDMGLKRSRLKRLIFSDRKARLALNKIIHPRVKEIILKDLGKIEKSETADLVVVDVPLLFEAGWKGCFDKTVLVYARPEVQMDRLIRRDGVSLAEAQRWLAAQMPIDEKKKLADYLVDNNGPLEETRKQVLSLMTILRGYPA
ncbi:MAG: dephospho-CoA kinase [Desulfovibrionales bacterium]|nr:dephospho-CoA kinase [Desulfovibrionales bacterium]